ncbi:protein arginine N-methyltransferase 6 [Lates japonicus]|uniref:Protein arginine N-methyltransferase 6 n=1 Tax=Lates japonicus TaxID=270547 RepID=A0AAD3RP43_LATJO|nr:protein arginine N-methyltransferase 6 [Lates japonicus]
MLSHPACRRARPVLVTAEELRSVKGQFRCESSGSGGGERSYFTVTSPCSGQAAAVVPLRPQVQTRDALEAACCTWTPLVDVAGHVVSRRGQHVSV